MTKRPFITENSSTTDAAPAAPDPARSHPENAAHVKRTYLIRADQDEAIRVALARAALDEEEAVQGKKQSEIIEALLDLGGFNQDYVDGKSPLRLR